VQLQQGNNVNQILREFEKQSGLEIYGLGAQRVKWEAAMERFAKLIIKECVNIADEPTSRPFESYGKKIKQHFGVEE
jgi:hypothetical protein